MIGRKEALEALLTRAERAGWAGADPYDGLRSFAGRVAIPLGAPARIAVTQAVLRSTRLRSLLRPEPSLNPKGLALFLGAVVRGRMAIGEERARALSQVLVRQLSELAADAAGGLGWGYPFPWQSRWFWAPAGTPNAVVTSTVAWHLLGAAEEFGNPQARAMAEAAARFLTSGLHWSSPAPSEASVSYTPRDRTRVVNVSALVARLLARLRDRGRAAPLAAFIVHSQLEAGGWPYALGIQGRWEDSFHTGFILEALLDLRGAGIEVPADVLRRGFLAYRRFFDSDGGARLYPSADSAYDAHSAAQGMVTYSALALTDAPSSLAEYDPCRLACAISTWALSDLWIPEHQRFAYRIENGLRDDRDYMRWVTAWMALGLASVERLEASRTAIEAHTHENSRIAPGTDAGVEVA